MKMKSFAILATSGLLAATFAYAVPALADDTTGQSMQQSSPSDNSMQNQSNDNSQAGSSSSTDMNNSGSTTNTDEGTPERDSATGDDDY